MKKISYERRVNESVNDESLSQKSTEKRIPGTKG